MEERRAAERRATCQHCPLTHEGFCTSHVVFSTFWKWGLSVATGLLVSGIALVWAEARSIHQTLTAMKVEAAQRLAEIQIQQAQTTRQVEVNSDRLDRIETRGSPRNGHQSGP